MKNMVTDEIKEICKDTLTTARSLEQLLQWLQDDYEATLENLKELEKRIDVKTKAYLEKVEATSEKWNEIKGGIDEAKSNINKVKEALASIGEQVEEAKTTLARLEEIETNITGIQADITEKQEAIEAMVQEITTQKGNALREIEGKKTESVRAVEAAKGNVETEINTLKENAISAIDTKQTETTQAVDTIIRQANTAKDNLNSAQNNAMEALRNATSALENLQQNIREATENYNRIKNETLETITQSKNNAIEEADRNFTEKINTIERTKNSAIEAVDNRKTQSLREVEAKAEAKKQEIDRMTFALGRRWVMTFKTITKHSQIFGFAWQEIEVDAEGNILTYGDLFIRGDRYSGLMGSGATTGTHRIPFLEDLEYDLFGINFNAVFARPKRGQTYNGQSMDNALFMYGSNQNHQLGFPSTTINGSTKEVTYKFFPYRVKDIIFGGNFEERRSTVILLENGDVWGAGCNTSKIFGFDHQTELTTWQKLNISNVVKIQANRYNMFVEKRDNGIWCCGHGDGKRRYDDVFFGTYRGHAFRHLSDRLLVFTGYAKTESTFLVEGFGSNFFYLGGNAIVPNSIPTFKKIWATPLNVAIISDKNVYDRIIQPARFLEGHNTPSQVTISGTQEVLSMVGWGGATHTGRDIRNSYEEVCVFRDTGWDFLRINTDTNHCMRVFYLVNERTREMMVGGYLNHAIGLHLSGNSAPKHVALPQATKTAKNFEVRGFFAWNMKYVIAVICDNEIYAASPYNDVALGLNADSEDNRVFQLQHQTSRLGGGRENRH